MNWVLINKSLSIGGDYQQLVDSLDSGTSWLRKVIKFGGFLTELGVWLRVMVFLHSTCPVKIWILWIREIIILEHVLIMSPEVGLLSPFSLYSGSCVTLPDTLLVILVVRRFPRLLQHRHREGLHSRLVPPECRQHYQISHPYPGSSWIFFLFHPLPTVFPIWSTRIFFFSEESGTSLTLTSSVDICQVPNLTNYQLQTLGYQHLVDKKMNLSTVGW